MGQVSLRLCFSSVGIIPPLLCSSSVNQKDKRSKPGDHQKALLFLEIREPLGRELLTRISVLSRLMYMETSQELGDGRVFFAELCRRVMGFKSRL